MVQNFRIFIYKPIKTLNFPTPAESLFYNSLQNSPFMTQNAEEADLFFVPLSPDFSPRSLARFIGSLRKEHPYWDRTLGADHFYLSCPGIRVVSDRNIVELKKNSVQVSCFPTRNIDEFVPHKDLTLPPLSNPPEAPHAPPNKTTAFLGYVRHGGVNSSNLVNGLVNDPEFLIESEPSDMSTYAERLAGSKFCLFEYGNGDASWIGHALRFGCVPVVIADAPVNDLPFMDVLRWQEMAVFVRSRGVEELKHVLRMTWRERYEHMRGLGVVASKHFVWNESPWPFDSFNTVMYQLWLRRHTIRYRRVE
ncbi:hypothetical protein L6164_032967 [Bauhinia variegata]|nr:hypothetical protein L6164_032967 [Bauhinia variegata]